jgi:hypothetical protein
MSTLVTSDLTNEQSLSKEKLSKIKGGFTYWALLRTGPCNKLTWTKVKREKARGW